eukprot:scaffold621_cov256-Chaetoceros_neogracile.AAC.5
MVDDWSRLVNITLFRMMIVDTWLAFNECTLAEETQKEVYMLYMLLLEELIDNAHDNLNMARLLRRIADDASSNSTLAAGTDVPKRGVTAHITPTKRRKVTRHGAVHGVQIKMLVPQLSMLANSFKLTAS